MLEDKGNRSHCFSFKEHCYVMALLYCICIFFISPLDDLNTVVLK